MTRTTANPIFRGFSENAIMSAPPPAQPQGQGHYDDGYGHRPQGNTDSYYQDEQGQYYDHNGGGNYADQGHPQAQGQAHHQGGDGYYDES